MIKLIILVVGAFLVARFWFGVDPIKFFQSPPEPQITPAPVSVLNLKRYTNDPLNFSISYPVGWVISDLGNEIILASTKNELFRVTDKNQIRVTVRKTPLAPAVNLKDFVSKYVGEDVEVKSQENLEIDRKPAIKTKEQSSVSEPEVINTYILEKDFVYIISAMPADSELVPIFNQMLGSFKFSD